MLSVFAFLVFFVLALVVLLLIDGYAKHMGDTDPTDWKVIILIAAAVGAAGAGLAVVVWDIVRFVQFVWTVLP